MEIIPQEFQITPELLAEAIRERFEDLPEGAENIDVIEEAILKFPQIDLPLVHRFTPGLYIRECFLPKNSLVTSVVHKKTHPFVISQGDISVWTKETPAQRLKAPHTGITMAGTRRLLFAHEDTIWTTFHVTDELDPDKVIFEATDSFANPLLDPNREGATPWRCKSYNRVVIATQTELFEKYGQLSVEEHL
jgi:hypothetical protein